MIKIAVIGIGYVGLPLALEFGKHYTTVGFDIDKIRVFDLNQGIDKTKEVSIEEIKKPKHLKFSTESTDLNECNVYIITVPTPIDAHKKPDLSYLKSACQQIGKLINKDDLIVFESTVYPGVTEEVCVPLLESLSNLKMNDDFYVGYSPERINPGSKTHKLTNIVKIVSGSNKIALDKVSSLYSKIIDAGIYKVSSIKIAESAKVIENIQRDLNVAFVNELSCLFNILGLDTEEILKAANTKWNFLDFKPGLVGGHCIGVDPYYLTYKAEEVGFYPKVILSGRETNDLMGKYIASELIKIAIKKNIQLVDSKILIMGVTFKEDCGDIRNSKVFDIYNELMQYGLSVDLFDPLACPVAVKKEYNVTLTQKLDNHKYDAVILAVGHLSFKELSIENIKEYCKEKNVIYDVKHLFSKNDVDGRL